MGFIQKAIEIVELFLAPRTETKFKEDFKEQRGRFPNYGDLALVIGGIAYAFIDMIFLILIGFVFIFGGSRD